MFFIFGSIEKIFFGKVENFFEHHILCKNCSRIDCAHQNLYILTLDRYIEVISKNFQKLLHNSRFSNNYIHIYISLSDLRSTEKRLICEKNI